MPVPTDGRSQPGQLITSTWIGSPTALNTISGSVSVLTQFISYVAETNHQSSAVPHVAGLIAYFIALIGNQSPADMAVYLARCATKNALSGVRKSSRRSGCVYHSDRFHQPRTPIIGWLTTASCKGQDIGLDNLVFFLGGSSTQSCRTNVNA